MRLCICLSPCLSPCLSLCMSVRPLVTVHRGLNLSYFGDGAHTVNIHAMGDRFPLDCSHKMLSKYQLMSLKHRLTFTTRVPLYNL